MDRGDPRCAQNLTLGGLEEAFSVCVSGWNACAHFHRISMEQTFRDKIASSDPTAQPWYETRQQVTVGGTSATQDSVAKHGRTSVQRATG